MRHLARFPEVGHSEERLLQQLEQIPMNRQGKDFSPPKVYNSVSPAWSSSSDGQVFPLYDWGVSDTLNCNFHVAMTVNIYLADDETTRTWYIASK